MWTTGINESDNSSANQSRQFDRLEEQGQGFCRNKDFF
jgi:hypothetical protein